MSFSGGVSPNVTYFFNYLRTMLAANQSYNGQTDVDNYKFQTCIP